jgi:protein-S-isoprenylcysteine O-methyltransferase Ste14
VGLLFHLTAHGSTTKCGVKNETVSTANQPNGNSLSDSPGVLVFPPALTLATFLLGLLLRFLWHWPLWPASVPAVCTRIIGAVFIALAIALAIWGRTEMLRAGTNLDPGKPALAIVTTGPFRFSRNPLYLANVLFYLGLTIILNSAWLLILFVPMVFVFRRGIIGREERYLEAKFGHVYLNYKAHVRRWL